MSYFASTAAPLMSWSPVSWLASVGSTALSKLGFGARTVVQTETGPPLQTDRAPMAMSADTPGPEVVHVQPRALPADHALVPAHGRPPENGRYTPPPEIELNSPAYREYLEFQQIVFGGLAHTVEIASMVPGAIGRECLNESLRLTNPDHGVFQDAHNIPPASDIFPANLVDTSQLSAQQLRGLGALNLGPTFGLWIIPSLATAIKNARSIIPNLSYDTPKERLESGIVWADTVNSLLFSQVNALFLGAYLAVAQGQEEIAVPMFTMALALGISANAIMAAKNSATVALEIYNRFCKENRHRKGIKLHFSTILHSAIFAILGGSNIAFCLYFLTLSQGAAPIDANTTFMGTYDIGPIFESAMTYVRGGVATALIGSQVAEAARVEWNIRRVTRIIKKEYEPGTEDYEWAVNNFAKYKKTKRLSYITGSLASVCFLLASVAIHPLQQAYSYIFAGAAGFLLIPQTILEFKGSNGNGKDDDSNGPGVLASAASSAGEKLSSLGAGMMTRTRDGVRWMSSLGSYLPF